LREKDKDKHNITGGGKGKKKRRVPEQNAESLKRLGEEKKRVGKTPTALVGEKKSEGEGKRGKRSVS